MIDGYIGAIAYAVGGLWHGVICLILRLTGSYNLDMVPYNLLRLFAGYLTILVPIIGVICWACYAYNY